MAARLALLLAGVAHTLPTFHFVEARNWSCCLVNRLPRLFLRGCRTRRPQRQWPRRPPPPVLHYTSSYRFLARALCSESICSHGTGGSPSPTFTGSYSASQSFISRSLPMPSASTAHTCFGF